MDHVGPSTFLEFHIFFRGNKVQIFDMHTQREKETETERERERKRERERHTQTDGHKYSDTGIKIE